MITNRLLKGNILFIAVAVTVAIIYLSLKEVDYYNPNIYSFDKIQHTLAYFVLGICWLAAIKKSAKSKKLQYIICVACIFFGIILEVLQEVLTTYRTADIFDGIANTVGVLTSLLFFRLFLKKFDVN